MKKTIFIVFAILSILILTSNSGCESKDVQTDSGIKKTSANIKSGADGLTIEQRNVKKRIEKDNEEGSIKHLYVISAYSGQILIYSTVDGKVTSSKKSLTPKTVNGNGFKTNGEDNFVTIGGQKYTTDEMIDEYGTYGNSIEYIFWFDKRGTYHQHYISGGQILHISDQPITVKDVIINMEIIK